MRLLQGGNRFSVGSPRPVESMRPASGLEIEAELPHHADPRVLQAAASNTSLRLGRAAASTSSLTRRTGVAAIGLGVLGLGLALVVLPGPFILIIPLGLMILAKQSRWARTLLQPVHKLLWRQTERAASRPEKPSPATGWVV